MTQVAPALPATSTRSLTRDRIRHSATQKLKLLLILSPVVYVLLLFIAPMMIILLYSLWTNGTQIGPPWTIHNYERFFESPIYFRLMVRSFRIALILVVLAVLFAFPVAYIIARIIPPHWRMVALAAIIIPSLSSFLIRTYAFIMILNERGMVNDTLLRLNIINTPLPLLYNSTAVFIGLLNVYLPFMVLPIYASLYKIDNSLYEAAANLGASRWQLWRRIIIPLSMPGVIAGVMLAFIPALGTFATPLILGGRGGTMYANTITSQFGEANNWPFGAALAMVLLIIVLALLAIYNRFGKVDDVWAS